MVNRCGFGHKRGAVNKESYSEMAEDMQRYLKRLLPTVEGLEGIIVSDRDGVHLVEAKDDTVSAGVLKPPFLGTFSIASEQASKLGLGRNRSIISYYTSHQVIQFSHSPLVVTFIAKTSANTGLIYSVEEDMRDAISDLKAAVTVP